MEEWTWTKDHVASSAKVESQKRTGEDESYKQVVSRVLSK